MVGNDHVGRLPLPDQGLDNRVKLAKFLLGKADAGPGVGKTLAIHPVGSFGIVVVLGLNGTLVARLVAPVAHKGRLNDALAFLALKARAYGVTLQAGLAVVVANDYLSACVHHLAMKTVNAEVVWIDKASPVVGVDDAVERHLLGYGGRIFAQVSRDVSK